MPVQIHRLSQRFQARGMLGVALLLAFWPTASPVRAEFSAVEALGIEMSAFGRIPPVVSSRLMDPGPTDLLDQLRREFTLDYEANRRIEMQRDWYVRHPEYLTRVFTRAQRYLPYIHAELNRRGLPTELALLPIVESAYDPFAYSHGRAAGLWQMIPGTARRFGVKQNWWYDGRRDIVDSTRAALDYLEYLYKLNDGDWLNAIASYNSGEGNVLKAVRRNRAANKPMDFWHLKVPKETSSYVPKLLALVDIVRDPGEFAITLPDIEDETQFVVAETHSQIDLALAAELAGIDVDTVYAFNPGYNRWATDPAGPHVLVIPAEFAEDFKQSLAKVPSNERIRWKRHKIGNGETISEIAQQYHTTAASIRAANNLSGNTIRAGRHLLIPVSSKPLSAYSQSSDARLARTQNRRRAENKVEHIVGAGESFWTISRRYGVATRQLAAWNGMAPGDTLSVGRKLVVWTDTKVAPSSAPTAALGNTMRKLNYIVRNGDSLYLIAKKFRISIGEIARWNNIDKNKILRPGQLLTMYVDVTQQSS